MSLDDLTAKATIAAVATCGLIGASLWAIAAGVLILTSLRSEACLEFADRYGEALGRMEAWSLVVAAAAARNTIVCGAAYLAACVIFMVA
jgi:hypothetical protein